MRWGIGKRLLGLSLLGLLWILYLFPINGGLWLIYALEIEAVVYSHRERFVFHVGLILSATEHRMGRIVQYIFHRRLFIA